MAISLILLPTIFTALFYAVDSQTPGSNQAASHSSLRIQLQDAKLKISRLESIVEEYNDRLNAKSPHIEVIEKKLEAVIFDLDHLQINLSSFEEEISYEHQRLNLLDLQVQSLWDLSRKNHYEIHKLGLDADDAEKMLKDVASKVEKMAAIVNEQWIQIQQLEQAVQLADIRVLKVKSQLRYGRCPFVKFIKNLSGYHLGMLKGLVRSNTTSDQNSYLSKALHQFDKAFAAIKFYHHQLQGFLKEAMEKYNFLAVLANDELVFLVASALVVFPILGTSIFLMSHLS